MSFATRVSVLIFAAACGGAPAAPRSVEPLSACELPPEPPAAALPGTRACTEMACVSGYSVWLDAPTGWTAGSYRFELDADGKHQSCTGTIVPGGGVCGEPTITCTGDKVAGIDELDCGSGFGTIGFYAMPCDVHVRITRGDLTIADRPFHAEYRWVAPNGDGCNPRCLQAMDRIEIP